MGQTHLASANPVTPPWEIPTGEKFSVFNMNSEKSSLCLMFNVNTRNSTSLIIFQGWEHKRVASYNYLQF